MVGVQFIQDCVAIKCSILVRQVQVMSTLPLKALSRLWGKFNELDIPYYLRVPGFRLYSFVFGVKLVNPHCFPTPIGTDTKTAWMKYPTRIFITTRTWLRSSTAL